MKMGIFLLAIHLSMKSEHCAIAIKTHLEVCFSKISQMDALNYIENVGFYKNMTVYNIRHLHALEPTFLLRCSMHH